MAQATLGEPTYGGKYELDADGWENKASWTSAAGVTIFAHGPFWRAAAPVHLSHERRGSSTRRGMMRLASSDAGQREAADAHGRLGLLFWWCYSSTSVERRL